jgi:Anti-sigma factor NepR
VLGDMSDKTDPKDERQSGNLAPARRNRSAVARQIEDNLKRAYEASLNEPVPDRFVQLLAQLRDKEGKS